ncbi:gliding motility-associated C-terminal domain-containing protein [Hymenobacter negativus]|uniref:Gliding motility-associated C-terminal domain-containing protein n=1 Tax=Hymenobacter negativus TaxID=2795026 RepID=A0ABS3QNK8_9BACT|nr:gliding motility-associated C-terminal domain-containing protein [Hymenobacter negativus]MBO2012868.1 gliding motility-associated C-terminal domain-containing protein [Hymenobacter negativus]
MKLLLLLEAGLLFNFTANAQADTHSGQAGRTLEFVENKGQWDARARYEAPLPGGRLFAETTGLTFALLADGGPAQHGHQGRPKKDAPAPDKTIRGHAFTLRFDGAAPATITAEMPTAEHRNYFLGADPKHWASDVRGYRALRYAGLWPGVNARVYESADQHLEYDFELAAGANPAAIALRHDGTDGVSLDAATGSLLVKTSVGRITERAPRAWQTDAAGRRQPVPCRYVLSGPVVRFALGAYDVSRPLTIDPVVVFSTYSGSTADNWGFTATYDNAGNLYSGGIAFGPGYPTSPGAFQTTFAALIDIAIIKYNTSLNGPAARAWATYIGGSSADFPHSLVVNSLGELLILGSSGSTNYPITSGAFQRVYGGGSSAAPFGYGAPYDSPNGSDLVVTRLNAAGTGVVGSTYLGGSGNDGLLPLNVNVSPFNPTPQLSHNYGDPFRGDILTDAANNVYIASHTTSPNFPVARGFNSTYRGGTSDGVVCKLSPDLTALTWSSFLGGSGPDAAYSIQIEPASGDVYVAGGTLSPNFPTTTGAYITARPGNVDGFVARISASGTGLLRATYVGTSLYDQAYFLQLGTDGGVYLLGQTLGSFPVSPGVFRTTNGTQFIQKLSADLSQSLLSTSFGSSDPDNFDLISLDPTAFLVDRCDRVYVCGWGGQVNGRTLPNFPTTYLYQSANGTTTGLPVTTDAVQPTTDGNDFYLAQFSAGLTNLAYATYYGLVDPAAEGEHVDGGTSRFDPRGIVYQAVCSCFSPTGFPIPSGAHTYSATNNSGTAFGTSCNNAAFVLNFQPGIANAGPPQTLCVTTTPLPLVGTPAGGIWSGVGVTGSVATGFAFTPSAAVVGTQTLTYTLVGTGQCTTTDTRLVTVLPPANAGADTVLCPGSTQSFRLRGTPAGGIFTGLGVTGSVATGFTFTPPAGFSGTTTLTYTITSATLCSGNARRQISVAPEPVLQPTWASTNCPEYRLSPLTLRFTLDGTGLPASPTPVWEFGDGTQSSEFNPTHTYTTAGSFTPRVRLRYNTDRCEVQATLPVVEVKTQKVPNIITPNGDGQNQTFQLGPDCYPRLQIFSRWGQQVFESSTYHDNWAADGLPSGVYYYLAVYPDGHRLKGTVEVVR